MITLRLTTDKAYLLPIYVIPKAAKTEFYPLQPSDSEIRIKVSCPPVEGQANREIIAFLAKALHLPKSKVMILHGEKSRHKQVLIQSTEPQEDFTHHLARILDIPAEWIQVATKA